MDGSYLDWIGPALEIGGSIFGNINRGSVAGDYSDALRKKIQYDYDQQAAYNAAVDQFNQQYAGYEAGQRAAAQQNANARASAARQTQANQQAAAANAQKITNKSYKKTMGMFAPFANTATELLPQMSGAYKQGMGMGQTMGSLFSSPEYMARMNSYQPASSINIPLPDYLKKKAA